MSDVLWRRLRYMLTPQWDIYKSLAPRVDVLSVLDIGFGTGFGTIQFNLRDSFVAGIETDPDAVEFARHSFKGASWWVGNICDPATVQAISQFHAITMIEVLEHIADWPTALKHVNELLYPGGKFYISARNRNADLRRNDLHEREWTAAEFRAALAGYFSDVKLYDYALEHEQGDDTHVTPLVAVCVK